MIWTLPDGQIYVTTPGSALLFPTLMAPTGVPPHRAACDRSGAGARTAMMPKRKTTRAQNRAHRINTERSHNHQARRQRDAETARVLGRGSSDCPDDDPPF